MTGVFDGIKEAIYAILILIGAVFSVLAWLKVRSELKKSDVYRSDSTEKLQLLEDLIDPDEDPDEEDWIDPVEAAIADIKDHLDTMPGRVRSSIEGSMVRANEARTKHEEEFVAGLESMMDQQWLATLPGWVQPIAKGVVDQADPRAVEIMRGVLTRRPEIIAHAQKQLTAGGGSQAAKPTGNPLDAVTGYHG